MLGLEDWQLNGWPAPLEDTMSLAAPASTRFSYPLTGELLTLTVLPLVSVIIVMLVSHFALLLAALIAFAVWFSASRVPQIPKRGLDSVIFRTPLSVLQTL